MYYHVHQVTFMCTYIFFYAGMDTGIEISASLEARDLLFFGWTCRISENFKILRKWVFGPAYALLLFHTLNG